MMRLLSAARLKTRFSKRRYTYGRTDRPYYRYAVASKRLIKRVVYLQFSYPRLFLSIQRIEFFVGLFWHGALDWSVVVVEIIAMSSAKITSK